MAGGGNAFNTCNEVFSAKRFKFERFRKYQVLLSASDLPEATNYWQKPSSSRSPALPCSLATLCPRPTLRRLQLKVPPQKTFSGLQKCKANQNRHLWMLLQVTPVSSPRATKKKNTATTRPRPSKSWTLISLDAKTLEIHAIVAEVRDGAQFVRISRVKSVEW